MNDLIAEMIARIKNGYQARKELVTVPYSKINEKIAQILVKEGFLKNAKTNLKLRLIETELKYEGKKPALSEARRISKPGLRIYRRFGEIPRVKQGFGITIVSTSKGLMVDREAKKSRLGGEIICQVW